MFPAPRHDEHLAGPGSLEVQAVEVDPSVTPQGYVLEVAAAGTTIRHRDAAGLQYARRAGAADRRGDHHRAAHHRPPRPRAPRLHARHLARSGADGGATRVAGRGARRAPLQPPRALHGAHVRLSRACGGVAGRVPAHGGGAGAARRPLRQPRDHARRQPEHLRAHGAMAAPRRLPGSSRVPRRCRQPVQRAPDGSRHAGPDAGQRGVRAVPRPRARLARGQPDGQHRRRRTLRAGTGRQRRRGGQPRSGSRLPRAPRPPDPPPRGRGPSRPVLGRRPATPPRPRGPAPRGGCDGGRLELRGAVGRPRPPRRAGPAGPRCDGDARRRPPRLRRPHAQLRRDGLPLLGGRRDVRLEQPPWPLDERPGEPARRRGGGPRPRGRGVPRHRLGRQRPPPAAGGEPAAARLRRGRRVVRGHERGDRPVPRRGRPDGDGGPRRTPRRARRRAPAERRHDVQRQPTVRRARPVPAAAPDREGRCRGPCGHTGAARSGPGVDGAGPRR